MTKSKLRDLSTDFAVKVLNLTKKGAHKMRRTTLPFVALLSSLLLVLSGCISVPVYKNHTFSHDDVASVSIYDLRESDTHYSGFHEKQEPVYTVPQEQLDDFLTDLSDIRFSDSIIIFTIAAVDPSFTFDDWVVRVNYKDGSFDLISCDYYNEQYDENGNCTDRDHFGSDNEFWNDLIKEKLPNTHSRTKLRT